MINFIREIWGDPEKRTIVIELKREVLSGIDTLVWFHNDRAKEDEYITREDVISAALHEYLNQAIWTTKQTHEKSKQPVVMREPEKFRVGKVQRRKDSED